jgi:VWFA-related protein
MTPGRARLPRLPAVLAALAAGAAAAQDPPRLPVHVDRVLVDARILDTRGRELRGLGPSDLRVEIDGRPARLESVEWVAGEGHSPAASPVEPPPPPRAPGLEDPSDSETGRLVVFLFQKDFFEPGRLGGLLRMKEYAAEFARKLGPGDRAAVLTYDSRLRLHLDFTSDKERLEEVLRHALLRDEPAEVPAEPGATLAGRLDPLAARRAATMEKGLEVLARALLDLPGAKSLVFLGWGLGRLQGGLFAMENDYDAARHALLRSRTAVFALDVSNADYHSLELGLQQVAEDTGGFFARTHIHPGVAMARLRGALAGHYVLALERPAGSAGTHRVAVQLVGRKGTVLARSSYVD